MKIQSIILICIIIINQKVDGNNSDGKLSAEENAERLETCGQEFLPQPAINERGESFNFTKEGGWLLYVDQKGTVKPKGDYLKSTGFPISKRHIIANSQVVFTPKKQWSLDGSEFNKSTCIQNDHDDHADLPQKIVENLQVITTKGITAVKRGRTFDICKVDKFPVTYTFILLEVSDPGMISENIPCVADETTNFKIGDEVHAYGRDGEQMLHHIVKIIDPNNALYTGNFQTEPKLQGYVKNNDRGGPLVLNYTGKATVIGSKDTLADDKSAGNYYNSMRRYASVICEYSGVCGPPPTTTMAPTTTPTTTSQPSTTTPDPTITKDPKISTTEKSPGPSTMTPSPPESPRKVTQKPQKDVADSKKDGFEGEVELVDEEDEVGVPVFFDIDSWNSSKGIELNFFTLILLIFVMIWY